MPTGRDVTVSPVWRSDGLQEDLDASAALRAGREQLGSPALGCLSTTLGPFQWLRNISSQHYARVLGLSSQQQSQLQDASALQVGC